MPWRQLLSCRLLRKSYGQERTVSIGLGPEILRGWNITKLPQKALIGFCFSHLPFTEHFYRSRRPEQLVLVSPSIRQLQGQRSYFQPHPCQMRMRVTNQPFPCPSAHAHMGCSPCERGQKLKTADQVSVCVCVCVCRTRSEMGVARLHLHARFITDVVIACK